MDNEKAFNEGEAAGLRGEPSTPHKYMHNQELRRSYEQGYNLGRDKRLSFKS